MVSATVEIPPNSPMSATERRKKFGQVFTPSNIAALMASWVMETRPKRVLDPAFGKGALAAACLNLNPSVKLFGYEIDPFVLLEVPRQVKGASVIKVEDFLAAPTNESFDGIIANPPYIRHRELKGHLSRRSDLSHVSGCEIPKSANQYIDFLVKATLHLDRGGRAAFLIPAEWMSANFSRGLKRYLLGKNLVHSIVTFSNCSNIFSDALTTASLVLLEKSTEQVAEISSYYLQSIDAATAPRSVADLKSVCGVRTVRTALLREATKWEPILRGDQTNLPDGWITVNELAATRRGIATGANEFFLISDSHRIAAHIDPTHVLPCVGHSNDVKGLIFTKSDFENLNQSQAKIWLLNFSQKLSAAEQSYAQEGEKKGLHQRYITKCRRPWFTMEQREPAPIWAGVFGRDGLRFVYNEAGARSLTNFHCIYPKIGTSRFHQALVAVLNSRSVRNLMVSHQRGYGGGLMKFEPKDLLSIPIPDLRTLAQETIDELADQLLLMHHRQCNGLEPCTERVEAILSSCVNTFTLVA